MIQTIPLFPLHTVLFPGGLLPLRIFEPRYIDMVSKCLQTETGFGVCLLQQGAEVGQAAVHTKIGTYARIIDWQSGDDGLLEITAQGEHRLQVLDSRVLADQLIQGRVRFLAVEPRTEIPVDYQPLQKVFQQLCQQLELPDLDDPVQSDDAVWLGNRLAGLLPFDLKVKQQLLETEGCTEQLDRLLVLLSEAGVITGLQ